MARKTYNAAPTAGLGLCRKILVLVFLPVNNDTRHHSEFRRGTNCSISDFNVTDLVRQRPYKNCTANLHTKNACYDTRELHFARTGNSATREEVHV